MHDTFPVNTGKSVKSNTHKKNLMRITPEELCNEQNLAKSIFLMHSLCSRAGRNKLHFHFKLIERKDGVLSNRVCN